jgi:hypothetical protein
MQTGGAPAAGERRLPGETTRGRRSACLDRAPEWFILRVNSFATPAGGRLAAASSTLVGWPGPAAVSG